MSDLIIKGMEMPRDCPMCKLAHFNKLDEFTGCDAVHGKKYVPHSDDQFWNSAERPEWCPLRAIPETAKMIDANMVALAKFSGDREGRYTAYEKGWNDALDSIKENAPAIIQPETKPAEATTPELKACPYCHQKPPIRKWGYLYRAECEQYACNNPYAAHGRTYVDCAETWNAFVAEIERDLEKEDEKRSAEDDK